ncbi:MAG: NAD(P)H-dependent glycerol-3-phosphate dehydrogenase [bacterium]
MAVIGAGSWGTAFARHLTSCGVATTLLARRSQQAEALRKHHRNPDYLSFLELPADLEYGTYRDADLGSFDLLVVALPSKAYVEVLRSLTPGLPMGVGVLSLTKGLEPATGRRLSEVLHSELSDLRPRLAVLSGPNQAEEVALGQPTATVIAAADLEYARTLQVLITNESLRAYVNDDLVGVELAGAVKNVVALATGMSDGLGYGDNARAALVTRGLAEMARLGVALGANPQTFAGLAGLGDLVGTCTSRHSRNRLAGELIAQGHVPSRVEDEMGMVAEGLAAARAVHVVAREHGVEMPIAENVVAVVFEGKNVRTSVRELMARRPRSESR